MKKYYLCKVESQNKDGNAFIDEYVICAKSYKKAVKAVSKMYQFDLLSYSICDTGYECKNGVCNIAIMENILNRSKNS